MHNSHVTSTSALTGYGDMFSQSSRVSQADAAQNLPSARSSNLGGSIHMEAKDSKSGESHADVPSDSLRGSTSSAFPAPPAGQGSLNRPQFLRSRSDTVVPAVDVGSLRGSKVANIPFDEPYPSYNVNSEGLYRFHVWPSPVSDPAYREGLRERHSNFNEPATDPVQMRRIPEDVTKVLDADFSDSTPYVNDERDAGFGTASAAREPAYTKLTMSLSRSSRRPVQGNSDPQSLPHSEPTASSSQINTPHFSAIAMQSVSSLMTESPPQMTRDIDASQDGSSSDSYWSASESPVGSSQPLHTGSTSYWPVHRTCPIMPVDRPSSGGSVSTSQTVSLVQSSQADLRGEWCFETVNTRSATLPAVGDRLRLRRPSKPLSIAVPASRSSSINLHVGDNAPGQISRTTRPDSIAQEEPSVLSHTPVLALEETVASATAFSPSIIHSPSPLRHVKPVLERNSPPTPVRKRFVPFDPFTCSYDTTYAATSSLPIPSVAIPANPQKSRFGRIMRSVLTFLYVHSLIRFPKLYRDRVNSVVRAADLSESDIARIISVPDGDHSGNRESAELKRFKPAWEEFIESLSKEWKVTSIITAIYISALIGIFQIEDSFPDPVVRTPAFLSLICALMSLSYGCIFTIRLNAMKNMCRARQWARELKQVATWWNGYVMFAMPAVWLAWSFVSILACIMAYLWRTGGEDADTQYSVDRRAVLGSRLAVSAVLLLGILYLALMIRTLALYGKSAASEDSGEHNSREQSFANGDGLDMPIIRQPSPRPPDGREHPYAEVPSRDCSESPDNLAVEMQAPEIACEQFPHMHNRR